MTNIVKWKMPVDANMTMRRFKRSVAEEDFTGAVIMGYDKDGDFIVRSSKMSRKDALWMLEQAKLHILDI